MPPLAVEKETSRTTDALVITFYPTTSKMEYLNVKQKEANRVGHDRQDNLSEDEKSPSALDEEKDEVPDQQRRGTIAQIERTQNHLFHDFVENTTLHGIKYVTNPVHSKPRRLIWTVLFAVIVTIVTMAIVSHAKDYLKYATNTVISFNTPKDTEFPKVIVCNCNQVRNSSQSGTKPANQLATIGSTRGLRTRPGQNSATPTDNHETDIADVVDVEHLGRAAAHKIDTMLLNCQWGGGQNCSADNFTQVWTDVGVCYEFNGLAAAGARGGLRTAAAGGEGGLWMQLNVEKSEYTADNDFGSCFKVAIQPRTHANLIKNQVIAVSPGDHSIVSLQKHWRRSLPHPYETNCSMKRLQYFPERNYTTSACRMECLTDSSMAKCGCIAPYMPASSGFPYCSSLTWPCVTDYVATASPCDCNTPCYEELYASRISYARASYAVHNKTQRPFNWSEEEEKENVVEISIYFEDFREEWVSQKKSYSMFDLMSSVGGELGLLLGGSVITIFEFIDFFVTGQALRYQWMKRKLRKTEKKKQASVE